MNRFAATSSSNKLFGLALRNTDLVAINLQVMAGAPITQDPLAEKCALRSAYAAYELEVLQSLQ